MCDQWLAVDDGNGSIEKAVYVSITTDIPDRSILFRNNINRRMFDDHIWMSVGYRKTKSTFSRVQRLCVCVATLFLSMVTSAIW